jgi:hypothetical protein
MIKMTRINGCEINKGDLVYTNDEFGCGQIDEIRQSIVVVDGREYELNDLMPLTENVELLASGVELLASGVELLASDYPIANSVYARMGRGFRSDLGQKWELVAICFDQNDAQAIAEWLRVKNHEKYYAWTDEDREITYLI